MGFFFFGWLFLNLFPSNFSIQRFSSFPRISAELGCPRQAGGVRWGKLIPGFTRALLAINSFSQRNCCAQNPLWDPERSWRIRDDLELWLFPAVPKLCSTSRPSHPKLFSLGINKRAEFNIGITQERESRTLPWLPLGFVQRETSQGWVEAKSPQQEWEEVGIFHGKRDQG